MHHGLRRLPPVERTGRGREEAGSTRTPEDIGEVYRLARLPACQSAADQRSRHGSMADRGADVVGESCVLRQPQSMFTRCQPPMRSVRRRDDPMRHTCQNERSLYRSGAHAFARLALTPLHVAALPSAVYRSWPARGSGGRTARYAASTELEVIHPSGWCRRVTAHGAWDAMERCSCGCLARPDDNRPLSSPKHPTRQFRDRTSR